MVTHTCKRLVSGQQPCCLSPCTTPWAVSLREAGWLFGENWSVWMEHNLVRGKIISTYWKVSVCVCVLKLKHDLKTLSAGDLTLTSTHPADIAGHARVHLVSWLKPASDSCDYKLERKRACLCGTESHLPVSSGIKHLLPVWLWGISRSLRLPEITQSSLVCVCVLVCQCSCVRSSSEANHTDCLLPL